MNKEVITVDGYIYIVVRKIKETQVKGNIEGLKAWRDYLHCDRLFNKNGYYYLVQDIKDIDYIQL